MILSLINHQVIQKNWTLTPTFEMKAEHWWCLLIKIVKFPKNTPEDIFTDISNLSTKELQTPFRELKQVVTPEVDHVLLDATPE